MDILQCIEQHESRATIHGDLANERDEAMDHYLGREYGDEVEGRSKVVMRDVADTIEWIKPSLLKIFCAGDEVVRFDPVGPEDEEPSQQETDYCNHIVMQKNPGFLIFHDWFHDALLQKNGYTVVRPIKRRKQAQERYEGLTDDEVTALIQADGIEVEVLEQRKYPAPMPETAIAQGVQAMLHDLVVRQVTNYTCIEIHNVPPERVLVHPDWAGLRLQDCPFVEVIDYKTISDLRAEGYDVDDDISDAAAYEDDQWAELARKDTTDQIEREATQEKGPNRAVRTRYIWVKFDEDGDGIAELRRVVAVGKTILENEEDDLTPVAAITPIRLPHEHTGLSIDDLVHDLQRIRTVLVRGFLDGMYLSMHGRNAIDTSRVNLDDMLVTRPGGVVRVNGDPTTAILPLVQPNNGTPILQAVEYIDGVRENRTGVTRYNQGLDADSLNKTATGINSIMSAAQQRIELIARLFAETGVKDLMLIVHAMSIKFGRKPEMLKLRGRWVPVDPRGWKTRSDLTVSVGIGTGNKDQMLGHLFMILQEQKQGVAVGLASPPKIYNTLRRITQNAGFKQAEEFWDDPTQTPQEPPGPPPEIVKTQMQLQADAQKTQAQHQFDGAKFAHEQEMEKIRLMHEADQAEKDRQAELRKVEIQASVQIELARISETSKAQHAAEDREFQAGQRQQEFDREDQGKQAEAAKGDEVLNNIIQTVQGLAAAIDRPLRVVRGPDGRTAELH